MPATRPGTLCFSQIGASRSSSTLSDVKSGVVGGAPGVDGAGSAAIDHAVIMTRQVAAVAIGRVIFGVVMLLSLGFLSPPTRVENNHIQDMRRMALARLS